MRDCMRTWLASPHVAEDLDVARDLFLCALDAGLLEVVDEELIAPAAAAAGVGGPGRLPVGMEACAGWCQPVRRSDQDTGTDLGRIFSRPLRTRPRCRP